MTVELDGTDIGAIVEGVAWGGSMIALLIFALIVYLLVRPPRHGRQRRRAERRGEIAPPAPRDEEDAGEMRRAMDRMEARLEVLERAIDDRPAIGRRNEAFDDDLTPAADGREAGRKD